MIFNKKWLLFLLNLVKIINKTMNYINFKYKFNNNIILSKKEILLNFPRFDNKNLTYWQKKWYIWKIIKSYYYFLETKFNLEKLFYISNNIYFPSYISSYSALSYYNLIPEQVSNIIAFSTNSTKTYKTDIWIFKYHNIKNKLFWWYDIKKIDNKSFYIADIEKTLLDFFYINKQYKTKNDILSLRLNFEILKNKLDTKKLLKYLIIFDNKTLKNKIFILLNLIENA